MNNVLDLFHLGALESWVAFQLWNLYMFPRCNKECPWSHTVISERIWFCRGWGCPCLRASWRATWHTIASTTAFTMGACRGCPGWCNCVARTSATISGTQTGAMASATACSTSCWAHAQRKSRSPEPATARSQQGDAFAKLSCRMQTGI